MFVFWRGNFRHVYEDCPIGLTIDPRVFFSITDDPRDCPWCLLRNRREVALVVAALTE